MYNEDRSGEFWGIVTWVSISYFVLFVVVNVAGIIWIKMTTEPPKKKIKKTNKIKIKY
jgi:hypothetical protein